MFTHVRLILLARRLSLTQRIATRALITILCGTAISSHALAQGCPDTTIGPINQNTALSISTFDNSCSLTPSATPSQDGGYLKVWNSSLYKLHVDTEGRQACNSPRVKLQATIR